MTYCFYPDMGGRGLGSLGAGGRALGGLVALGGVGDGGGGGASGGVGRRRGGLPCGEARDQRRCVMCAKLGKTERGGGCFGRKRNTLDVFFLKCEVKGEETVMAG